jgi:hypothetical protein
MLEENGETENIIKGIGLAVWRSGVNRSGKRSLSLHKRRIKGAEDNREGYPKAKFLPTCIALPTFRSCAFRRIDMLKNAMLFSPSLNISRVSSDSIKE